MSRLSIGVSLTMLLVFLVLTLERLVNSEPERVRSYQMQRAPEPQSDLHSKPSPRAPQAVLVLPPPPQSGRTLSKSLMSAPTIQSLNQPPTPPHYEPVNREVASKFTVEAIVPLTPTIRDAKDNNEMSFRPLKPAVLLSSQAPVTDKPVAEVEPEKSKGISRPVPEAAKRGRVLLRMLEHGTGPSITISWPEPSGDQDRLYRVLTQCYGMEVALIDTQGVLFSTVSGKVQKWAPNLDRYSGFIRQVNGAAADVERQRFQSATRSRSGTSLTPVRVFRRQFDGVLLGGLIQLSGGWAMSAERIKARYSLIGHDLSVEDIQIDGEPISGRIDLATLIQCREET